MEFILDCLRVLRPIWPWAHDRILGWMLSAVIELLEEQEKECLAVQRDRFTLRSGKRVRAANRRIKRVREQLRDFRGLSAQMGLTRIGTKVTHIAKKAL
jgi:hypothetical protein